MGTISFLTAIRSVSIPAIYDPAVFGVLPIHIASIAAIFAGAVTLSGEYQPPLCGYLTEILLELGPNNASPDDEHTVPAELNISAWTLTLYVCTPEKSAVPGLGTVTSPVVVRDMDNGLHTECFGVFVNIEAEM